MRRVVPSGGASIAGHVLPQGTILSVPQWAAYRSPSNFISPSSFLPERWLTPDDKMASSSLLLSPYALDRKDGFNPFSLGSRSCPGRTLAFLELRLILAKLLWHFDLTRTEQTSVEDLPAWEKQDIYWFWVKKPMFVKLRRIRCWLNVRDTPSPPSPPGNARPCSGNN